MYAYILASSHAHTVLFLTWLMSHLMAALLHCSIAQCGRITVVIEAARLMCCACAAAEEDLQAHAEEVQARLSAVG